MLEQPPGFDVIVEGLARLTLPVVRDSAHDQMIYCKSENAPCNQNGTRKKQGPKLALHKGNRSSSITSQSRVPAPLPQERA